MDPQIAVSCHDASRDSGNRPEALLRLVELRHAERHGRDGRVEDVRDVAAVCDLELVIDPGGRELRRRT